MEMEPNYVVITSSKNNKSFILEEGKERKKENGSLSKPVRMATHRIGLVNNSLISDYPRLRGKQIPHLPSSKIIVKTCKNYHLNTQNIQRD
jgi:hypothetical protein